MRRESILCGRGRGRGSRPGGWTGLGLLLALVVLVAGCGGESAHGPACLCEQGAGGETLWCEACGSGWVAGQRTSDKAAVDRALAELVRTRAAERGLAGAEVDRILSDIAAGVVKQAPPCRCEACASGQPAEHDGVHEHEHDAEHGPAPTHEAGPATSPAGD